jgi:hypothetical protein
MGTPGVRRRVAAVRRDAHRAVDVLDVGDADEPNLVARLVANLVEHQSVTGANLARLQHEPAVVNQRAHCGASGESTSSPSWASTWSWWALTTRHRGADGACRTPLRAPDRMALA